MATPEEVMAAEKEWSELFDSAADELEGGKPPQIEVDEPEAPSETPAAPAEPAATTPAEPAATPPEDPPQTPEPPVSSPEPAAPVASTPPAEPPKTEEPPESSPAPAAPAEPPTPPPADPPEPTPEPAKPTPSPAPAPAPAAAEPPAETEEERKARETFEASIKPYEMSAEETEAVASFRREFPTEAKAVDAMLETIRRDYRRTVFETARALSEQWQQTVQPMARQYASLAERQHAEAIYKAHPDYDQVADKIKPWIDAQPAYLREPLMKTYEQGDTASVIDMVARVKKELAAVAPAPKPAAPPPPARPAPATDADALLPVGGKRTTPNQRGAPDPNDADAAWAEVEAEYARR